MVSDGPAATVDENRLRLVGAQRVVVRDKSENARQGAAVMKRKGGSKKMTCYMLPQLITNYVCFTTNALNHMILLFSTQP